MELSRMFKSVTINFNVFIGALVVILTNEFGMTFNAETVAAIITLGNILLRLKTNKTISEK